ncbi:hypothetical protein N0V95_008743 [Ascochyta clinopodiicola]|nr:hypothetical protein N0V95_008743 [Ascochyta clinopodiicola]
MDPRYNQQYGYPNGSNVPYTPPQPQNGYQQYGQPPQYPQQYPPPQMQMHHGYPQHQQQQRQPQGVIPRQQSQQYMPMPQQTYSPQQQYQQRPYQQPQYQQSPQQYRQHQQHQQQPQQHLQPQHQHQQPPQQHQQPPQQQSQYRQAPPPQARPQPQVMITQRAPNPMSYPQMSNPQMSNPQMSNPQMSSPQLSSPNIRQVHMPIQRTTDLSVMLLSAADEYIAAARGMGSAIARQKNDGDIQQYYKLMSTAMGCMDTVLRNYNMQPRDEAKLRLRYASLLIEETDNTEIDEILSKGISLCARCRLQDLRYSMLHLQARYQFKTNHRAAFKALDKHISEAETFQQLAWVYAFRFLKVSLLLQSPDRVEAISALQHLHAILAYAEKRGDVAIAFACNALEAMVHLRSSAQDRIGEAQRAIAAARSLQSTMSAKQRGSFGTLFSVIDLACGVHQNTPDSAKSTALIEATADENDDGLGTEDGIFTVLLDRTPGGSLTTDTGGIFRKNSEGRDELVFAWLPREDVKALCFHICALDQGVHEKALQLVQEARSRTKDSLRKQSPYGLSMSTACAQTQWRKMLDWHATFTLGLIATRREEHAIAKDAVATLTRRAAKSPYADQQQYSQSLSYLEAIIDQTNGYFDSALATYSSEAFVIASKSSAPTLTTDLGILAALNRLLIARDPAHPDHQNVGALLVQLRSACEDHPSQYVRMAYSLVNALSTLDPSINRLKTLMNNATQKSHELFKRTHNREFVVMALCYFTARFFIEPVTDKSSSAANAVRQHAKQSNRPLWIAVACGLMIKVYEHHNIVAETRKYQDVYEQMRVKLPPPLRGDDVDAEGEDDDGDLDLSGS